MVLILTGYIKPSRRWLPDSLDGIKHLRCNIRNLFCVDKDAL